jgi:hypothetical protein
MGWRGQDNRERAAEEERRAWLASLSTAERWRVSFDQYGPVVFGTLIAVGLFYWLT